MEKAFLKVAATIESCTETKQMKAAKRMISLFHSMYNVDCFKSELNSIYLNKSNKFVWF